MIRFFTESLLLLAFSDWPIVGVGAVAINDDAFVKAPSFVDWGILHVIPIFVFQMLVISCRTAQLQVFEIQQDILIEAMLVVNCLRVNAVPKMECQIRAVKVVFADPLFLPKIEKIGPGKKP